MNPLIKSARKIMGRLPKGSDLILALEKCCQDMGIKLGEVQAIGAVSRAKVGYYDQAAQKYAFIELGQPMEILSLIGNVSLKDQKPFVHAHITLADENGRAFGGHLAEGTIVFACEFSVQEYISEKPVARGFDEDTGLFLWPESQD